MQTAEGALTEVHDMLQRMNELAVKASNGTQSESDRNAIQSEIDQLVTEIDRVAITTKFNETYLLKGRNADGTAAKLTYSTAAANLKGKIGSVAVSTIDGTFSIAVTSISVGAGVSGTVPAELDAKLTSSGLKYLENTSMSVQSVKVGNTTYYVINSTSAKSTSSMAANVSEVVDAIGSSIAFASMDDMIMQIFLHLRCQFILDSGVKHLLARFIRVDIQGLLHHCGGIAAALQHQIDGSEMVAVGMGNQKCFDF